MAFQVVPSVEPAIEVADATVCYGSNRVLDGIDFYVAKGVIAGLLGPNGVGKTTLLRLIAGLFPGSTNCVRVSGLNSCAGQSFKRKLFFIEEARMLDSRLSGMDYLRYVKSLWHSSISIENIIVELGIQSFVGKPLFKLSLGMRQQIILSLAFASAAPVILFDEPMNSLDPGNADVVSQQLLKLKRQGTTILLSTHLLSNIDELADIVYFLKDGQISQIRKSDSQRSSLSIYREIYIAYSENVWCKNTEFLNV